MARTIRKKRIWYYLLVSIIFTGMSILFNFQQSYAQNPTPSPIPSETPTEPSDSPSTETTEPSEEATTGLPSTDEDANLPETLDTPTTQSVTPPNPEDVFSFDFLGFNEGPLQGPTSSMNFFFGVPADWQFEEGVELKLDFSTFFDYLGLQPNSDEAVIPTSGGSIDVLFNDEPLTTLPLDELGEQSITIPIPNTAMTPARDDRRHKLELSLESGLGCGSSLQTSIEVHPTSYFVLPHSSAPPLIDLRLLPWPIQQRSFLPDTATIVVPDQPTEIEMQAALAVATGFGKMALGDITLSITPIDQLTPTIRETDHLIFVGKGEDFPLLEDAELPAPLGETGFEAFGAFPEDGIIQMATSPWNDTKVILVVGGDSDIGVTKASQAISVGEFLTSGRPDLALIAEVQPDPSIDTSSIVEWSLADLGYQAIRVGSSGSNRIDYEFEIPFGYIVEDDAFIDLVFNHSALIDFEQSGGVVSLNGQTIGSLRFSDESVNLTTMQLTIPRSVLRAGINTLTVEAGLKPQAECYDTRFDIVWLTVWPESLLHLPLVPVQGEVRALFELNDYPEPFESNATLNNVAFIVPTNNVAAWNVAAQVAYDLGNRAKPTVAEFAVAYGDDVSESIRQNHHLLVIGRPSQLPLLAELREELPAPFEPGSDIATERGMRVVSRILPDTSFGYLESLPAPWNRNWTILALLGSTDQGLEWASTTLITNRLRNQLAGNLAIIDNEHISIGDLELEVTLPTPVEEPVTADTTGEEEVTQEVVELEAVDTPTEPISDTEVLAAQISEIPSLPADDGRPDWLLPALITSISLMVVIVGIVIFSAWRQHSIKE